MLQLRKNDLHFVLSRVPKDVRQMMINHPGLTLGGGFIRATIGQEIAADLDFFGSSKESLLAYANELAVNRGAKVHNTDNAITVLTANKLPVQFITRWLYDEPVKVVESFDFTVCQAVIWANADGLFTSACSLDFYPDLAAKRLVYTAPARNEDAGGSMLRVLKYQRRGYNIQMTSLGAVISRLVSGINFDNVGAGDMRNEADRAKVLTGLLREVDPLTVIDGIEPVGTDFIPTA